MYKNDVARVFVSQLSESRRSIKELAEKESTEMAHLISFVNSLELADVTSENVFSSKGKLSKLTDNKSTGHVDAGSLVSFTEKLSGQNKADVLNSTLLAQLAATKKYDREAQYTEWYKKYTEVMSNIGWSISSFEFTKYHSKQPSFEISKVVLELLVSLIGAEDPLNSAVKKTLEALKSSSSDTIKLFGSLSSSGSGGNFQVVPCTLDKSGQVNVAFIGSYFKASNVKNDFLFFSYNNIDIDLSNATLAFTLNEEVYSKVRKAIVEKLGDRANTYVKDLDI